MSNASISSFRHFMNYERREYKANDLVWFCIVYCLYIKQAFWLQYISLSLIYFILKIKICIVVCITMSTATSILVLDIEYINEIPILVLEVDNINGISQLLFCATRSSHRRIQLQRSPSQRERTCEPWKILFVFLFFICVFFVFFMFVYFWVLVFLVFLYIVGVFVSLVYLLKQEKTAFLDIPWCHECANKFKSKSFVAEIITLI